MHSFMISAQTAPFKRGACARSRAGLYFLMKKSRLCEREARTGNGGNLGSLRRGAPPHGKDHDARRAGAPRLLHALRERLADERARRIFTVEAPPREEIPEFVGMHGRRRARRRGEPRSRRARGARRIGNRPAARGGQADLPRAPRRVPGFLRRMALPAPSSRISTTYGSSGTTRRFRRSRSSPRRLRRRAGPRAGR